MHDDDMLKQYVEVYAYIRKSLELKRTVYREIKITIITAGIASALRIFAVVRLAYTVRTMRLTAQGFKYARYLKLC